QLGLLAQLLVVDRFAEINLKLQITMAMFERNRKNLPHMDRIHEELTGMSVVVEMAVIHVVANVTDVRMISILSMIPTIVVLEAVWLHHSMARVIAEIVEMNVAAWAVVN